MLGALTVGNMSMLGALGNSQDSRDIFWMDTGFFEILVT